MKVLEKDDPNAIRAQASFAILIRGYPLHYHFLVPAFEEFTQHFYY